jgi:uncharacterized protein (TIGR03118 family)
MKTMIIYMRRLCAGKGPATYTVATLILTLFTITSCNKNAEVNSMDPTSAANQNSKSLFVTSPLLGNIQETILVANVSGLGSQKTDPVLVNAWGMAMGADNSFWIACNHSGLAEIYGADGHRENNPIDIPLRGKHFGSSPTGVVYNSFGGFVMPETHQPSRYIFSTEDGIIAAWGGGDSTVTVADRGKLGAIYKGIAIANNGGTDYIYATDFHNGRVDVFDQQFAYVSMPFSDPKLPQGFAPFNIKNIDGKLFVTYARQDAEKQDDQPGAGNGFIDVFNTDGTLYLHFAAEGYLNSPWGMVETETGGHPEHILVGNFGDGRISVFDMKGNYTGQLAAAGKPLAIAGLWDMAFKAGDEKEFEHTGNGVLYFTAGPANESQGLFGYLQGVKGNTEVSTLSAQPEPKPYPFLHK